MKGYLIDAQTKSIHIVEVSGVKSAASLIGPDCKDLNEIFSFRNGDTIFADKCGFWPEKERIKNPEYMGMITSDMEITSLWPFYGRILILGCSINTHLYNPNCTYENPCDVKSTEEQIAFWVRFFTAEDGWNWLTYNFNCDLV